LFRSIRGTSDVESFHQLLEMRFQPWNAGPRFSNNVLAVIRHRFNIRRSEENRVGFPKIGHYEHYLLDRIQTNTAALFGKGVLRWWIPTLLYNVSPETFGIVPCVVDDINSDFYLSEALYKTDAEYRSKILEKTNNWEGYTPSMQYLCMKLGNNNKIFCNFDLGN
jgi:hypothetical protein